MTTTLAASTPSIILGTNVLGWNVDAPTSHRILDAAVERGLTAIDTADIYSYWATGNAGGESETIIGNWMKARGNRSAVQIHTKGGAPGAPGEFANGNATAAYLTKAVDASLKRLGTDYIDLYYLHYDDNLTPPEDTLGAFQRMIDAGKVRAIGGSNYNAQRLTAIMEASAKLGLPRYAVLQTHYNMADREVFEKDLGAVCEKYDLGVMAYFALARGFLSGKYRTKTDAAKSAARGSGATDYLNPRGLRILAALDAVAAAHGGTCAQAAIAWLNAKPRVKAIASATSIAQLDDLKAAMALKLTPADMATLDDASREG